MSKSFVVGVVGCALGVILSLLSGMGTTTVAQASAPRPLTRAGGAEPGRYTISSVQMEGNRALVVVLDTATGEVQPYFHGGTHDGLSFFPIRTQEMKR